MQGLFRSLIKFNFILFLSAFLIACSGSSNNGDIPNRDTTPPTVVVTPDFPIDQIIPVAAQINAVFNEAMDIQTVKDGFIVEPLNGGRIDYDPSIKTATYVPSAGTELQGDTQYTVTLKSTIKDKAGNALKEKVWSFKTEDNVAPILTKCIPSCESGNSDSVNVVPKSEIYLIFNEPIFIDSISKTTFEVKSIGASSKILEGNYRIDTDPNTVVFSAALPDQIEPATSYIVTVKTGIQDNSPNHNGLEKPTTFTFTTGSIVDSSPPIIKSITPSLNSKNISPDSVITIEFASKDGSLEVMASATIDYSTITVEDSVGNPVNGLVTFDSNTNIATFTPTQSSISNKKIGLHLLETYKVTVSNTIKDIVGNPLDLTSTVSNNGSITFSTGDSSWGAIKSIGAGASDTTNGQEYISSINENGDLLIIWEQYVTATNAINLYSLNYKQNSVNGWSSAPTKITENIHPSTIPVTTKFQKAYDLVSDPNGSSILVWSDITVDAAALSSIRESKIIDGVWQKSSIIQQGSNTVRPNLPPLLRRNGNGSASIAWMNSFYEDVPLSTNILSSTMIMRILPTTDQLFGSTWNPLTEIVTPVSGEIMILYKQTSDSIGNFYSFFYRALPGFFPDQINVIRSPYPAVLSNTVTLAKTPRNVQSPAVHLSSDGHMITSWTESIGGVIKLYANTFDPIENILSVNNTQYIDNVLNVTFRISPSAAIYNSGKAIIVYESVTGDFKTSEYDPASGWGAPTILETPPANHITTSMKTFVNSRGILTMVWLSRDPVTENTIIQTKRYKSGVNFGWQSTQSVNTNSKGILLNGKYTNSIEAIQVQSGVDGRAILMWRENFNTIPSTYDLFAKRLK